MSITKSESPMLKPKKGCATCRKRRIRCDETRPSCKKCAKKGLECPGYGARIIWAGGVAVRGRLRGLQIPDPKVALLDDLPHISTDVLGSGSFDSLTEYYDKNIAPMMVWIDSDQNIYRRFVLPLAQKSPVVRLAVAAVSAQHAAVARGDTDVPEDARNEAVLQISKRVTDLTEHLASGCDVDKKLDRETAEWMLASMLVLANYELARSGAEASVFHRKAARSLLGILATTNVGSGELLSFLKNQLAIDDVFSSTTSFDRSNLENVILPDHDDTVLFADYLIALHGVTRASRDSSPPRDRRADFDMARGATLLTAGRLAMESPQQRRDFIRLVDIHHNSAIVYMERCFGRGRSVEATVALSDLYKGLSQFEELERSIHNLPWPIFIAGAESYDSPESQALIRRLYATLSKVTGFKHHNDALHFLEVFWSSDLTDWRILATQWETVGRRILAV